MNEKIKAQHLVEGILIIALVAFGCIAFVTRFDLKTLRDYVLGVPATDSGGRTTISVDSMTETNTSSTGSGDTGTGTGTP